MIEAFLRGACFHVQSSAYGSQFNQVSVPREQASNQQNREGRSQARAPHLNR